MRNPRPESTWTQPRPDCPRPGYWHATDSQSTELEVSELVAALVRALQPEYVIETGTCFGQTAQIIGMALVANEHGRLDTLEPVAARADVSRQWCAGLPVTVHEVSSLEFVPDDGIDFAWLDSRFELRIAEFERYRPWMHEGTVVGFHDTAPHHGPMGAEVERIPGTRCIRLRTPRGVTLLQLDA